MQAANDNRAPAPPLSIRLAAVDTLESFWHIIHAADRRDELAARRDWRRLQELRAKAYSGRW